MKQSFLLFGFLLCFTLSNAQQVPLNSVVEHFTNTRCSICKNRNPGFYNNVFSQKDITHLSIHPSSPYSACILSKQNTVVNDARTNYYGIYGGTPRLVINGSVISSSSNYNDAAIFNPFQNLMSSFEVKVDLKRPNTDSLNYTIVITKKATSNLSNVSLFSGLAEDSVFVDGGNGEPEHYNVLRYAIQENINLPATIGDSLTLTKSVFSKTIWNNKRMMAIALLQETTSKTLIQSGKSRTQNSISTSINDLVGNKNFQVFPNPTSDFIYTNEIDTYDYQIINLVGENIQSGKLSYNDPISLSQFPNGLYIVLINNTKTGKFSKASIQLNK